MQVTCFWAKRNGKRKFSRFRVGKTDEDDETKRKQEFFRYIFLYMFKWKGELQAQTGMRWDEEEKSGGEGA